MKNITKANATEEQIKEVLKIIATGEKQHLYIQSVKNLFHNKGVEVEVAINTSTAPAYWTAIIDPEEADGYFLGVLGMTTEDYIQEMKKADDYQRAEACQLFLEEVRDTTDIRELELFTIKKRQWQKHQKENR